MNEAITITPHWGDRARDAFHAQTWPMPNKIAFAQLVVVGAILAAVAVAIV